MKMQITFAVEAKFRSAAYLITLSAFASTLGGIVSPICFAVFRLITSSNFAGCSTGRSAALRLSEFCPHKWRRDGIYSSVSRATSRFSR
jgi:hypothetical protein